MTAAAFAKHEAALKAKGVEITDDLVKRLVAKYYRNHHDLGIPEAAVVSLALDANARVYG